MTNLFLYIQIRSNQQSITYTNKAVDYVKKNNNHVLVYEIDNFSDQIAMMYANQLIKESEKILVFLDLEEVGSLKQVTMLLNNLLDRADKVSLLFKGSNVQIEKMISILSYQIITENTHEIALLETMIREFL